jgi:hypothetical protein
MLAPLDCYIVTVQLLAPLIAPSTSRTSWMRVNLTEVGLQPMSSLPRSSIALTTNDIIHYINPSSGWNL